MTESAFVVGGQGGNFIANFDSSFSQSIWTDKVKKVLRVFSNKKQIKITLKLINDVLSNTIFFLFDWNTFLNVLSYSWNKEESVSDQKRLKVLINVKVWQLRILHHVLLTTKPPLLLAASAASLILRVL